MPVQSDSGLLIDKPLLAAAGVGISACLLARKILVVWVHASPRPQWIHTFDEILPPWTRMALHLLVYGILVAWFIEVVRDARGSERWFLGLLLSEGLLYPLRNLLPIPGAAILLRLQLVADVAMLAAALQLFTALLRARKDAKAHVS